jgi:hypothetical protein
MTLKPEEALHMTCQQWLDLKACSDIRYDWLYHTPNGGARHPVVARKLKLMGVKAGIPDYLCHYPSNGFTGLAIELKAPGGKLTKPQETWLQRLKSIGYRCAVCFDFAAFKAGVEEYFNDAG